MRTTSASIPNSLNEHLLGSDPPILNINRARLHLCLSFDGLCLVIPSIYQIYQIIVNIWSYQRHLVWYSRSETISVRKFIWIRSLGWILVGSWFFILWSLNFYIYWKIFKMLAFSNNDSPFSQNIVCHHYAYFVIARIFLWSKNSNYTLNKTFL